jgi:hypothetical protein
MFDKAFEPSEECDDNISFTLPDGVERFQNALTESKHEFEPDPDPKTHNGEIVAIVCFVLAVIVLLSTYKG